MELVHVHVHDMDDTTVDVYIVYNLNRDYLAVYGVTETNSKWVMIYDAKPVAIL